MIDPTVAEDGAPRIPAAKKPTSQIVPIGYLRAFITLLVLAHHAVLAYHPFAPLGVASLTAEPRWWQAFPVVDALRSPLVSLFTGLNDTFFMALMFLLSGLFVAGSLDRKGARAFLRRRFSRLGLPFLAVAAVVAPLAYYPTYLSTANPQGVGGFVREWLSLGSWPAGPGWFLWLLLAFDAVAAAVFTLRPSWAETLGRRLSAVTARPILSFAVLVAATALAYLPTAAVVSPLHWTELGPFAFQTSRIFHYAVYFFAGIVIGAQGLDRGLLAAGGRLARRWPLWGGGALVAYAFAVVTAIAAFAEGAGAAVRTAANLGFVVSCAAACFACLSIFLRFARASRRLYESLRSNAYGMYLFHYAWVSWLQYALLPVPLPALGKAFAAVLGTTLLSWGTSAALRQVGVLRRIL